MSAPAQAISVPSTSTVSFNTTRSSSTASVNKINNPQNFETPFSFFSWKHTTSTLSDCPFVGRVPPLANHSPHSLFIDTKLNKGISEKAIFDFFRKDLLGIVPYPDENFVQLTFASQTAFETYLNQSPIQINNKPIHLSPPRNYPRKSLVIHLHGLPIIQKSVIHNAINTSLSPFCTVKEIAPIVYTDSDILTTKWDAVVSPLPDKKIPVHLKILNCPIALTWFNSDPVCLHCKAPGHSHHVCPQHKIHLSLRPPNDARTYAQATSQQLNHKTNLLSQHSSSTPLLQPNSQSTPSMPPTTTTQSTSSNLVFVDETLTAMESVMSTSSENSDNANYFDSEMTLDSNNENTYENTNNLNMNETSDVQTSNDTKHNDDNSDTNMQTDTSHLSPKLSSSASLNYAPLSSQNSDPNDTNPYHTVTRSSIKKQRTN